MSSVKRLAGSIRCAPEQTPVVGRAAPSQGDKALYHRTCGHVIVVHPHRAELERAILAAHPSYRFKLRIRTATQADWTAYVAGISCDTCRGAM